MTISNQWEKNDNINQWEKNDNYFSKLTRQEYILSVFLMNFEFQGELKSEILLE